MELSIRLRAVADLVTAGYTLADIGTDHAYLPISLLKEGRIPSAIAMDVNRGPLDIAGAHVAECGLADRVALRLSDGFSAIRPGEVESAVIAGMGGALVIRILREGADVVRSLKECILQPQSELDKVRTFLLEEGFFFLSEDMVKDGGKYYPMMRVAPPGAKNVRDCLSETGCRDRSDPCSKGADKTQNGRSRRGGESPCEDSCKGLRNSTGRESWTKAERKYGKLLLEQKNPVLREYLQREIRIRQRILSGMKGKESEKALQRKEELLEELALAKTAAVYYTI